MSAAPAVKFHKRSNALRSESKSRGNFAMVPKEILLKKWPAARFRIFTYILACADDALIFSWTLASELNLSRSTVIGEINWLVRHGYLGVRKVGIRCPDGWRDAHTWDVLPSSSWREKAETPSRTRIQKTGHEPELPENENPDSTQVCEPQCQSPTSRKLDTLKDRRKYKSKTKGGKSAGNKIAPRDKASEVTPIRQKITLDSLDADMSAAIDGRAMGCREREKFLRTHLIQRFSRDQIQMVMRWRSGPKANFFIREFGYEFWRPAYEYQRKRYWDNLRSLDYWAQLIELAKTEAGVSEPAAVEAEPAPSNPEPSEPDSPPQQSLWELPLPTPEEEAEMRAAFLAAITKG
jgi:hypothetical protein